MGQENPQTKRFLVQFKKCIYYGQLILREIIKIVATTCQILRLKCTKFDFCWGSAPDPAGGTYIALLDPLAVFKGPTSKGREGRGGKGEGKERAPISCWHRAPKGLIRHWVPPPGE